MSKERQADLERRYKAIINDKEGVFLRLPDTSQKEINGVLTRLRGPQLSDQALASQERDLPVHEQYISQQLVRERQAALERRYAQIVNNGIFLRLPDIFQKEINGVLTRLRGSQLFDQELTAQERDLPVHEQYIPQQLAKELKDVGAKAPPGAPPGGPPGGPPIEIDEDDALDFVANQQRQAGLVGRYEAIANDRDGVFRRLPEQFQTEINGVLTRLRTTELNEEKLDAQTRDLQEHEQYIPQQLAKEGQLPGWARDRPRDQKEEKKLTR